MPRHKWFGSLIGALAVLTLLLSSSCIPTSPEFTVTFIISQGITGTPAAGTYSYKEFEAVPYKYEVIGPEYVAPEILINGAKAKAEGEIKVFNHYTVEVRQIDIRNDVVNQDDNWSYSLYNKYGGLEAEFTLRFVGPSNKGGTFSDTRGYHGTWTIVDSKNLIMTFSNWDDAVFSGEVGAMSGTWTMSSYPDAAVWNATRSR